MKVKLLRKVRKRYSITHYPNGLYMSDIFYAGPISILWDNNNEYRWRMNGSLKESAYCKLYAELLEWIQKDYGPSKGRTRKLTSEQLWYKK